MDTITALRVGLWATDPVSRAGLEAQLDQCPEIELVAEAEAAEVAVLVAQQFDEATQQLARRLRRSGVQGIALLVAHVDDQGLFAAVESGISAILRREEATTDRLRACIRNARNGHGSLPSDLLGRLMQQVNHLHDRVLVPQGMHLSGLSDRELEVLRLVADGHATSEIAAALSYSERTIKNIMQGITARLNLRNRTHAVAYALRQGLI